jgi:hypothetical protein
MSGFVYVLSNVSMPKILKIGKSDRDPTEFRVNELYTTGVPQPFKVEYFAYVEDHHRLEKVLHSRFDSQRINSGREFFQISVEEVVVVLRQSAKVLADRLFYKSEKEIQEEKNKLEQLKKNKEKLIYEKEIEEKKLKLDAENSVKEKRRWEESVNFARKKIEDEKINLIKIHVDTTKIWQRVLIWSSLLMSPLLIVAAPLFPFFIVIFIVPVGWHLSRNYKDEEADKVFNNVVFEKVANLHYKNKDWVEYLQEIKSEYVRSKKIKV